MSIDLDEEPTERPTDPLYLRVEGEDGRTHLVATLHIVGLLVATIQADAWAHPARTVYRVCLTGGFTVDVTHREFVRLSGILEGLR